MATQLEQERREIRARVQQHQQVRVRGKRGDDYRAAGVLEDHEPEFPTLGSESHFDGGERHRRDMGGQPLGVQGRRAVAVNKKAVAAEHDGRVDAVPAPQGTDQIANGGHRGTLSPLRGEVKRQERVRTACPDTS